MQSFTSFQNILQGVARNQGFELKLWEYRLQTRWTDLVGEGLAAHTWPSRLKFRKLLIIVENSVWLHQLTYLKSTLLEKIHSEIGHPLLTDLVFRVGEIPSATATISEETMNSPLISAEAMMAATECSRVIEDQNLRNAFTRLIAKALVVS